MAEGASTSYPSPPFDRGRPELTSDSWHRVKGILAEVLSCPPDDRAARLEGACGDDHEMCRLVASYLEIDPRIDEFFERGARPSGDRTAEDGKGGDAHATTGGGGGAGSGGSLLGRRIGPYKVLSLLSKGGMGEVYLAEREGDFEKRVALKIIRRGKANDETVRWFHNERQILARLEHPNIARLLDGGTTAEGLPYLVMEYIDGEAIDRYCDRHGLSLGARLELFLQVCQAVQYAHQKLVIHCDLKPGNVLITRGQVPKIVDFGIARLLRTERDGPPRFQDVATALRGGPLTPDYASPEHLLGFSLSTVSDVYSLGVVLYLLVCGHLPYNIRRPRDMERPIFRDRPRLPSTAIYRRAEVDAGEGPGAGLTSDEISRARGCAPRSLHRRIQGDLDHIVLKAMSRDPERRYASAGHLAEDVRRHLEDQPVTARRKTFAYLAGKFLRRNKPALAIATLVVALLVGFAISATVLWQRAESERRQAVAGSELLEDLLGIFGPARTHETASKRAQILGSVHERLRGLAADSELRAILMNALGLGYQELDQHPQALALLAEAVEIEERLHPGGHPRLARMLDDLGELFYEMGRPGRAEVLFRRALALENQLAEDPLAPGEVSADALRVANNLATALLSQGKYQEAAARFEDVLEMKRRLFGEENPESLIVTRNNLALALSEQARYQEAVDLYRVGLERRIELHGLEHPDVAASRSSLGIALYAQGNLPEAEAMLRAAVEIRRRYHGADSLKVATSLNNLGLVLHAAGDLDGAEESIRKALEIRQRLGSAHQRVAVSEKTLAALLLSRERPGEAEGLARHALHTFREQLPEDHWRIADAESVLGHCLTKLGRHQDGEKLLFASHTRLRESRGEAAIYTRLARERLEAHYATTAGGG